MFNFHMKNFLRLVAEREKHKKNKKKQKRERKKRKESFQFSQKLRKFSLYKTFRFSPFGVYISIPLPVLSLKKNRCLCVGVQVKREEGNESKKRS